MRDRRGELDVAHALAPHLGERHLDTAFLADHAAVLEALVLAAQALVVLDRPEDLGAEQAVTLGLERAVVDRLRLLHLAVRPRADLLGRCEPDADRVEFLFLRHLLEQIEQCFHSLILQLPGATARGAPFTGCLPNGYLFPDSRSQVPDQYRSMSTSIASERISFTSTLNDSGMPASILCSPLTMFS